MTERAPQSAAPEIHSFLPTEGSAPEKDLMKGLHLATVLQKISTETLVHQQQRDVDAEPIIPLHPKGKEVVLYTPIKKIA